LKKYNFHAVGFVVQDWIFDIEIPDSEGHSVCLSKSELSEMQDVFEYANHTKSLHTRDENLTALQKITKEQFIEDYNLCEKFVTTKKIFAYPFGIYDKRNVDWIKEIGVLLAFTSDSGLNNKMTNPLELKRDAVILHFDFEIFRKILLPEGHNALKA